MRDPGELHAAGAVERRQRKLRLLRLRHADRAFDVALQDVVAFEQPVVERFKHAPRQRELLRRAGERHHVAARPRVDFEPPLDQRQVLVELAAKCRGEAVVFEDEVDLLARRVAARRIIATLVDTRNAAAPRHQATASMTAAKHGGWPPFLAPSGERVSPKATGEGADALRLSHQAIALSRTDASANAPKRLFAPTASIVTGATVPIIVCRRVDLHRLQPRRAADDLPRMPSRLLEEHVDRQPAHARVERRLLLREKRLQAL